MTTEPDTQEAEILRVVARGVIVRDPSALARQSHRSIGVQTDTDTDQAPSPAHDEALIEETNALNQELREKQKEHAEARALSDLRNRE